MRALLKTRPVFSRRSCVSIVEIFYTWNCITRRDNASLFSIVPSIKIFPSSQFALAVCFFSFVNVNDVLMEEQTYLSRNVSSLCLPAWVVVITLGRRNYAMF